MKMTKIWITIVMMAIMTVAFTGCGNSDDGSGSLEDGDAAVGTETTTVEFETVDLDGKTVSSRELFAENKVTMINFWGTFCGPCIREMPELAELATGACCLSSREAGIRAAPRRWPAPSGQSPPS